MGKFHLKNYFSFSDLFKYKFFLRIGNSIEDSTFFSISVSLIIIAPLLIYFFLIASDTFQHSQASINVQEYDVNERPYLTLSKDNFRLAFRIILANTSIFSGDIEEYFDFQINYTQVIQNHGQYSFINGSSFKFETCKETNFKDFLTYYDLNLKNAFCLKDHSMDIGGYWDEGSIGWFQMDISLCDQKLKKNCKSSEIIKNELKESFFYVYIESQDVDASNYENPLKKSLKTYFQVLDFSQRKESAFYMQKVEIKTYDNLIYNTKPSQKQFNKQINMVSDNINIMNDENSPIIRMRIFSSNKIQIIERTYLTLVQAAAIVGGISSFVIVLGSMITFKYNDMNLNAKLINKLYSFDFNENKNEINSSRKKNIQLFSPEKKKTKLNNFFEKNVFELKKLKAELEQTPETDFCLKDDITHIKIRDFNSKLKKNEDLKENSPKEIKIELENLIKDKEPKAKDSNEKGPKIVLSNFVNDKESKISEILKDKSNKKFFLPVTHNIEDDKTKTISLDEFNLLKEKNTQKLKFTTWELLNIILFPFLLPKKVKKKYKLYEKSSGYLMKYINIFFLIKMLEDVEKMKSILFNNHQLTLFNYISKPKISLIEDESREENENYMTHLEKSILLGKSDNNKEIVPEIKKYYKELKMAGNWNLTDIKLFDYLDEDFKKMLKC